MDGLLWAWAYILAKVVQSDSTVRRLPVSWAFASPPLVFYCLFLYLSGFVRCSNLSTYFKYPQEVRRLIYTTNTIEGFNRQLRKVTKSKSVLPTDASLLKMLYLAMMDITKKWTGRRQDWSLIHAQMAIYFAGRMPE